jgi:hypothetical protein
MLLLWQSNLDTVLALLPLWCIWFMWLMANRNLTLLYCYWIYGIMMLPGMASGFIQEYLGYGNFYLGVSSHYSWINLSRFWFSRTTLERNLKLVNSSDYRYLMFSTSSEYRALSVCF